MRSWYIGLLASLGALSACAPSAPPPAPIVLVGNQQTGDLYTTDVLPGEAARKAGHLDVDINDQNAALAQLPNLAAAHFERGHAYVDEHQWAQAIADLTVVIQQPTSAQRPQSMLESAYDLRATAYLGAGQYPQAIADDSQLITLDPQRPGAWSDRCMGRALSGKLHDALTDCTQALVLAPDRPMNWVARGFVHLKMKNYDAAIDDNRAALKLNPKLGPALYGLGLAQQGKHEKAAAASLAAARAADPNAGDFFNQ